MAGQSAERASDVVSGPTAFVGKLFEEQDGAVLREGIRVLAQALMESEVAGPGQATQIR